MYSEIERHLLQDERPSEFLSTSGILPELKETPQNPVHHPEGNVWNHTLLVIDKAASRRDESRNPRVFMWAALLHDIGKPATTMMRDGRLTAYGHDKVGAKLAYDFLVDYDPVLAKDVSILVRWHMQIFFIAMDRPYADIKTMKSQADVNEVALLGICDRLGRLNVNEKAELDRLALFWDKIRD